MTRPLPRPTAESHWLASAAVRISDDGLAIEWSPPFSRAPKRSLDNRELLAEFLDLKTGSDSDLVRFARAYGPLHLCEHGLPMTHWPQTAPANSHWLVDHDHLIETQFRKLSVTEPLAAWRAYAQRAASMLAVSAHLMRAKLPPADAWSELDELLPLPVERLFDRTDGPSLRNFEDDLPEQPPVEKKSVKTQTRMTHQLLLDQQRRALVMIVQTWLGWSDVGVRFEWPTSRPPSIRIGASTLFGTIALTLAQEITGTRPIAMCAGGCGDPVIGKRARQEGKRAWCTKPECRREKSRLDSEAYRARKQAGRTPV